ncbi:MAG: DNA polymerase III subunit beta [Clostridia bacterium]|jgi:DNA polymerase-3 subunit beta|nr:DNA polymerase III subunit beta [Clostridia bacterium]MCI8979223.1 DNA polymerase III subunit beta [Clostridia bacterium]MCI9086505.1 DNA polymerase III subunit beta [Clostridia bacterium]NDO18303.1 DNA polymerase III subunit beta [Lachnospiraceae bacterium MD329]
MKLVCSKPQLIDVINTVQRAIAPKTALPILECIKIDANGDGNVVFTGNNIDICIEYNTKCTVTEGGTIAIASKMFGEIVRRLPEGDVTISVNPSNFITKIKSGSSEFNIQGIAPDEFPDAPILDEKFRFTLNEGSLKKLIRKTISFVAQNEGKKPVLTGALFEIKDNSLNVVASDGHRLAVVKEEIKETVNNYKFVVPGMTLRELIKILKDEEDSVNIIVSDRTVLFDFGYYQVYSRLLDGEFLKYDAIISAVNTINVVAEKRYIMDSLERAQLLINDDISAKSENKVPVRFNIAYDKIDVSCITGKGQVNDTVPVELDGGELIIGFNCRFLLDALSACDEEQVKMEFSAPTSGCFIRSVNNDDSYIYMILPVRLYN